MVEATQILEYWNSIGPDCWWKKSDETDDEIRARFLQVHGRISRGEMEHWLETADEALAYVIVLDQFSRNMFRDDARAFAQDEQALAATLGAIEQGFDLKASNRKIAPFFYLPLEHSEDIAIQELAVEQMIKHGDPGYIDAARWHYDIIKRFGRFPHRNKVLGRTTTPEEQAYLDNGGFQG